MAKIRQDENLIVVYQDEVHFQAQATVTAAWYKKGSEPQVKSLPGRSSISYSGFLIQETGELFVCKPEWFNTSTTVQSIRDFLASCPPPPGKKYAVVMDNASWHTAMKKMIGFGQFRHPAFYDISDYVVFIDMPPYSPDLNPIEQVWRITRKEYTHNRFFENIGALESTTDSAFANWSEPNEQLQSLCGFM